MRCCSSSANGQASPARRARVPFATYRAHRITWSKRFSGDGRAWYQQLSTDYGVQSQEADVREARPELELPKIID